MRPAKREAVSDPPPSKRGVLSQLLSLGLFIVFPAIIALDVTGQRSWRRDWGGDPRHGIPDWELDQHFTDDKFTFVRLRYSSHYGPQGWGRRGRDWRTDYPDADLNFSFRLEQLTSIKTDPDGLVLDITDPRLDQYPFVYIVEPGSLRFETDELPALRNYLLNGGFLMVDDFWGEDEYANFYREIKRVFPDREPIDLPLDHPIFRTVFTLDKKPQVPSPSYMHYGYERRDAEEVHYRGVFDDQGRMMVIICHNTDLGDGWEQEAIDPEYFHTYSEKQAYPMGINIVVYALTH